MNETIVTLYNRMLTEAEGRQLTSLLEVLPFVYEIMDEMFRTARSEASARRYESELLHCLQVGEMLSNLELPIPQDEEDTMLAAVILHIMPETCPKVSLRGFPEEVLALLEVMTQDDEAGEEEQYEYFARVQENRLAFLAMLADRGNIIQQLYRYPTWSAHRYIEETKACYYPMCVYGKEHYHELLEPICLLTERLQLLMEVSEILLRRYEVREAEMNRDILALRDENATIRGIIAKFLQDGATAD